MRATFSYASILHAVGQVLDSVGVSSVWFEPNVNKLTICVAVGGPVPAI